MSYQGPNRRSQPDEAQGLAELSIKTKTPVDQLPLQRATDVGREDELRASAKAKLLAMAGFSTEKADAELSPVVSGRGEVSSAVEVVQPKLLTLGEADDFLREHNIPINLSKAREEDVRDMLRWGSLTKKEAESYGAAFDNPQIPLQALLELEKELKANPDLPWEPEFELENRINTEVYDGDIIGGSINHWEYRVLAKYRRVDPKTKRVLPDQRPSNKARVMFTPSMRNVDPKFLGISANDQLGKMVAGGKYMPPSRWIKRFLRSVDEGLRALHPDKDINKMPFDEYKALRAEALKKRLTDGSYPIDEYLIDTCTVTQFPDLRSIDGMREDQIKDADLTSAVVPYLYFVTHPDSRKVRLYGCLPDFPYDALGGRPELG